MTSLTFYGGVNEIGGNKILLEDKGTKIFLDFGMQMGKAKCRPVRDVKKPGPKTVGVQKHKRSKPKTIDKKC